MFLRFVVMVLAIEALFFVLLRLYIRSLRCEKLEKTWDEQHPDQVGDGEERDNFVRESMAGFESTLKARLTWGIFILPNLAIMGIVYWVNWQ